MSETPAGEHSGEKDAPRRRDCPDCGGYQFKSVAGIWRHWPIGPDFESPVECPITSAETAECCCDRVRDRLFVCPVHGSYRTAIIPPAETAEGSSDE